MSKKLLIIGAGTYALLAYEIACDTGEFDTIDFVDDQKTVSPIGTPIVGTTGALPLLANGFTDIIVAIGNPHVRLSLLDRIEQDTNLRIANLISPHAYVAPSAVLATGIVVEPHATVHTLCRIERGCLICAGAVVNHESVCEEGCHIDCNATVPGYVTVPSKTKVPCGTVYVGKSISHL